MERFLESTLLFTYHVSLFIRSSDMTDVIAILTLLSNLQDRPLSVLAVIAISSLVLAGLAIYALIVALKHHSRSK